MTDKQISEILEEEGYSFTKCCRKAPSFSCGDIRQLF